MSLKLTVITPSFNQGHFISETIDSVMNSGWNNIEYIVMDGGSKDNTVDILKEYSEKYPDKIIWQSEKDRGQTHAINKGLALATGDIICYLNSDDFFTKGAVENVMNYFTEKKNAKWLTGDYLIIDENGKEIQSFVASYKRLLRSLPKKLTLSIANYIIQPSTFWRREIFTEFGEFNEDLHLTMDYDYWMRIIKKYPPHIISSPLSAFRIHGDSKGGTIFEKQFAEEYSTAKKHGVKGIPLLLHKIHNIAIVKVYKLIK